MASSWKTNRSFVYLLPMLGDMHKLSLKDLVGFKGIYTYAEMFPEKENHIFAHFFFLGGIASHSRLELLLKLSPHLEDSILLDKNNILYCFKVPENYQNDYDLFKNSKYSKINDKYKKIIIKFHAYSDDQALSSVKNVLYRTEKGYDIQEAYINKDLPKEHWTRIPRDQEVGFLMEEIKENETFKGI